MAFTVQPLKSTHHQPAVERKWTRWESETAASTAEVIRRIVEGHGFVLGGVRGCGKALLRRRVHSVRRSERDGRTGFASLGGRAPISPVRTVRVGHGPDGHVHPEEYRKWRNDPKYQRTASESEGKSGVRESRRMRVVRKFEADVDECEQNSVLIRGGVAAFRSRVLPQDLMRPC
jgi:hypothetical protein